MINSNHRFTIAELKNPKDGEPKVVTYTIHQFLKKVECAAKSHTVFEAYHFQKQELSFLSQLARESHANGKVDQAKELKAKAKNYKEAINATKFGPAKKMAEIISAGIVAMDRKVLLLTSATNETDESIEFMRNPSAMVKKYDVVISTPVLSTGVAELRTDFGYTTEHIPKDEDKSKIGSAICAEFKDLGTNKAADIFNAQELYPQEVEDLAKKGQYTNDEYLALTRYRLQQLMKESLTLESVAEALKQQLLSSFAQLRKLYVIDDDTRIHYDLQDRKYNSTAFTVTGHLTVQHDLINFLCLKSSINLDDIFNQLIGKKQVEISADTLKAVAHAFNEKNKSFNYFFEARINEPENERNFVKVWNATIGVSHSLPLIKKKLGTREKRISRYFIDSSKNNLIIEALDHSQD